MKKAKKPKKEIQIAQNISITTIDDLDAIKIYNADEIKKIDPKERELLLDDALKDIKNRESEIRSNHQKLFLSTLTIILIVASILLLFVSFTVAIVYLARNK